MVKINFLRDLFKKPSMEVEIPVIELKDWLEEAGEEKLKPIDNKIKNHLKDIGTISDRIREKLETLKEAKLLNENISPREKHMVEGNRFSYIKKIKFFLDSLKLPKQEYEAMLSFAKGFEKDLEELGEKTSKGYYLLKNYYDREVTDVAADIKELEKNVIGIRSLVEGETVKSYRELFKLIRELNEQVISFEKADKQISEIENKVVETEEKKQKLQAKMEEVKQSRDFKEYNDLESKKKELKNKLDDIESGIKKNFLIISKPLRKFKHETTFEELVDSYQEDPLDALKKDKGFKIADILAKMGKDKKLDMTKKITSTLDSMDKKYFEDQKKKADKIVEKISSLNSDIEKNTVMMNFKELAYQLDHVEKKIKDLNQELDEKRSEKANLNIEKKRSVLEKQMGELTGHDVTIII